MFAAYEHTSWQGRTWRPGRGAFVALVTATALAGCSPYVFTEEIATFDKATVALNEAAMEMRQDLLETPGERAFWAAYNSPKAVEIDTPSCINPVSPECFMTVNEKPADVLQDDEQRLAEELKGLKILSKYGAALKALTNAQDREAFDAANARLANAVSGVVMLGGAKAAPFAGAAGAFVSFGGVVVGAALDSARRAQLEDSILKVEKWMPPAADAIGKGLIAASEARINHRTQVARNAAKALASAKTARERRLLIETVTASTAEIRRLRSTDPAALADQLKGAHTALANAVQSPEPNLAATLETIQQFADAAATLRQALGAL